MKKLASLLLALCVVLSFSSVLAEEKTVLEWFMYDHYSNEIWQADPIMQYAQDQTGIVVNVNSAPWGECDAKLNLMLANGELPDVYMNFWYPWTENFSYLVEDGEIVEITDMLDNYPNLKAYVYGEESFRQLFVIDEDGKEHIYGVPRYYPSCANYNIAIRTDLLKKYNLEIPTTWDELHDALATICASEDIAGLTFVGSSWLQALDAPWTNCNGYAKLDDGTWTYEEATEGYRDFLAYFAKWYEEGLIDPDMLLAQSSLHIEKMAAGKCVASIQQWNPDFVSQYRQPLQEMGAEIALIPYLVGPEGTNDFGGTGAAVKAGSGSWLGWQLINARTGNAEKVLEFYDFLLANDGVLTRKGVEGLHYKVNPDGSTTWLDAYYEELERPNSWSFKYDTTGPRFFIDYLNEEVGRLSPLCENADLINEGWAKVLAAQLVRAPYTYQFNSENSINYSSAVSTVVSEWRDAFLTGKKSTETDWDAYIAALNDAGASKIMADLTEWMAAHE